MMIRSLFPVLVIVAVIMLIWYAASVGMNKKWTYDQAARAKVEVSFSEMVADTWSQDRPVLCVRRCRAGSGLKSIQKKPR